MRGIHGRQEGRLSGRFWKSFGLLVSFKGIDLVLRDEADCYFLSVGKRMIQSAGCWPESLATELDVHDPIIPASTPVHLIIFLSLTESWVSLLPFKLFFFTF